MKLGSAVHVEGGALCSACRRARPFDELLAYGRVADISAGRGPVRYVCRPSVSDMRFPLCTSRALASAAVHAITLAGRLHEEALAPSARRERELVPAHIRNYRPVLAAS